jgi:hypothetical protein
MIIKLKTYQLITSGQQRIVLHNKKYKFVNNNNIIVFLSSYVN